MTVLRLAAERRVLFVTGKGGVGKTSVASAVACARARDGARVLVVSTDPAHNLGHVWDRPVGDRPTRVMDGPGGGCVDALEVDPQATVDRHLAAVRDSMRRLLPERLVDQAARHLALARHAPGTHESAVLERIAEAVELGMAEHDLVVFDTAPSGQTARLMALPDQLTTWTETLLTNRDRSERFSAALRGLGGRDGRGGRGGRDGPGGGPAVVDRDAELRRLLERRRARFTGLRDVVTDRARTSFALVLAAERLPVVETIDLHDQLVDLGLDVGRLVVNRRSPLDAGDLLAARRGQEDRHLATVRRRLAGVPLTEVPLLPGDLVGEPALAALATALGRPDGEALP